MISVPEKREHSPTENTEPEEFYSEDWDEFKQEEDEWQILDKWQKILQMVFHSGCLGINPEVIRDITRSCTQHQHQ